ncbi:MAG TPA: hypothetical protein VFP22_11140 [Candidatus Limnocylindrales bacterium]|nr:hypothetical protein [Candidatus Limnocylindrales bacterium]
MARRTSLVAVATGVLAIALWGCGAAATPIPSAAAPSVATTSTAPSEAASTAPSVAASAAESTGIGGSFAIPSFSLPSDDKGLEAILPDTICGEKATKASFSGARFAQAADPSLNQVLSGLGKSASDVSFAIAAGTTSDCQAGIFRVAGVDQNALQSAFLAAAGATPSQTTVGGKSVFSTSTTSTGKEYVYFHGDAAIFASAPDDTKAASILQTLP